MKNRVFSLIFVIAFAAVLMTACAGGESSQTDVPAADEGEELALPEIPDDVTGGSPWIDSVIAGNVTKDTRTSATDDFYLYANKDWIISHELTEGSRSLDFDNGAESRARGQKALAGEALSGHDGRQAQLLYKAFIDVDARDAAGCEPARRVIDDIRSISSIEQMNAFLIDLDRSAGVPTFIKAVNGRDYNKHRWITRIELSEATFGSTMETLGLDAATVDPASRVYKARYGLVENVLTRAGYTKKEAKKAFEGRLKLEKEIIRLAETKGDGQDESANYTIDQLDTLTGEFPLREIVRTRGYGSAEHFEADGEAELAAMASLYTDENIEDLRNYLICGYVLEAGGWLDTKAFNAWQRDYEANVGPVSLTIPERNGTIEETAVNLAAEIMPTPMGRAYVEAYDLSHTKEFVTNLAEDAIEAHKEIVSASQWLSDESKEKLTGKLSAIRLNLVYPDVWEDYSGLDLEGLDYYGARRAIWLDDIARNADLSGTEIDDRLWESPSLVEGGGAYSADDNSFRVYACAVDGEVERFEKGEITLEQLLGGFTGYMLFHEPAHALDPADIFLDAKGEDVKESLLTPADLKEYKRRTNKIEKYFDSISIWKGQQVKGSICTQEALAEICGMQARLAYAAKQDSFDYQSFFMTRAQLGPTLHTPEYELEMIMGTDRHPSIYLDTNVTFQQFDEFMEAYSVEKGDGMYLAPDERLVIW